MNKPATEVNKIEFLSLKPRGGKLDAFKEGILHSLKACISSNIDEVSLLFSQKYDIEQGIALKTFGQAYTKRLLNGESLNYGGTKLRMKANTRFSFCIENSSPILFAIFIRPEELKELLSQNNKIKKCIYLPSTEYEFYLWEGIKESCSKQNANSCSKIMIDFDNFKSPKLSKVQ